LLSVLLCGNFAIARNPNSRSELRGRKSGTYSKISSRSRMAGWLFCLRRLLYSLCADLIEHFTRMGADLQVG
jgi:hypothetical protein